jgi:hypothetical protein
MSYNSPITRRGPLTAARILESFPKSVRFAKKVS